MLAVLVAAPALAASEDETVESHSGLPQTVIVLDSAVVRPSEVTLEQQGALVFENHSVYAMLVHFIEPKDAAEKIHCHFVRRAKGQKAPSAPWLLFGIDAGKVAATIPPGRFASLCSFTPGTYAFTAEPVRISNAPVGRGRVLPEKGQIVVR